MTTALQKTPTATALASTAKGLSEDQVDLIKRTICKGATNDELRLFVTTANRLGLDPFARQIFAVKRQNRKTGVDEMAIQVSIDGFRLVAERTGCYAPGRRTEFEYDDKGRLACAIAFIKKHSHGEWHEVSEEATFTEFAQSTPLWSKMPRVMLAKCAEARALRRAFPNELSGVYAPEEIDDAIDVTAAPAVRAPERSQSPVEPEVVDDDRESHRALLLKLTEASSIAKLEALIPALSRVPKAAPAYSELRALYAQRKKALASLAARASAPPMVDSKTGEQVPPEPDSGDEHDYDPETGEVMQ